MFDDLKIRMTSGNSACLSGVWRCQVCDEVDSGVVGWESGWERLVARERLEESLGETLGESHVIKQNLGLPGM